MAKLVWPCADFTRPGGHAHASEGMPPARPGEHAHASEGMPPAGGPMGNTRRALWRISLGWAESQRQGSSNLRPRPRRDTIEVEILSPLKPHRSTEPQVASRVGLPARSQAAKFPCASGAMAFARVRADAGAGGDLCARGPQ